MISTIPALDFMRSLRGTFKAKDNQAELRVWSCGYGVALELKGEKKVELVGVIGAYKNEVECYALVGLPNVIRFESEKTTKISITFTAKDLPISFLLSRDGLIVTFTLMLQGNSKVSHVLHPA